MDAVEVAPRRLGEEVERLLGAAGQQQRVVLVLQLLGRNVLADVHVAVEDDAFRLHLLHAPLDDALLHLEIGDAVDQQPAGLGALLVDVHLVAGAGELLGRGEPGGTRADDGDPLAGLPLGGSGATQPSSKALSAMAHSMVLMVTGLSSMLSVQDASHGAGHTRPVTSGKLLVECRLSAAVFH